MKKIFLILIFPLFLLSTSGLVAVNISSAKQIFSPMQPANQEDQIKAVTKESEEENEKEINSSQLKDLESQEVVISTNSKEAAIPLTPEILILSPQSGATLEKTITIEVEVKNNDGSINFLELYSKSSNNQPYYIASVELDENQRGKYFWDTTALPNGVYYLLAQVGEISLSVLVTIENEPEEVDLFPLLEKQHEEIQEEIEGIEEEIQEHQEQIIKLEEEAEIAMKEAEKLEEEDKEQAEEIKEQAQEKQEQAEEIKEQVEIAKKEVEEVKLKTQKTSAKVEIVKSKQQKAVKVKMEETKQDVENIKKEVKEVKTKTKQIEAQINEVKGERVQTKQAEQIKQESEKKEQEEKATFKRFSPNQDILIDSDGDGLSDEEEKIYGADPFNPDTDGDGYLDGVEVANGYNPLGAGKLARNTAIILEKEITKEAIVKDSDNDGITDEEEKIYGADPFNPDTDGDGYLDGEEVLHGHDPLNPSRDDEIKYEEPINSGEVKEKIYKVTKVETITSEITVADGAKKEKKYLKIQGKALPNSFVVLYIYSKPIVVIAKADSDGNWTYMLDKTLEDGEHKVYAAVTNNTGKIVAKSKPLNFFVREAKAVDEETYYRESGEINVVEPTESLLKQHIIYFSIMLALIVLLILLFFYKKFYL